MKLLFFLSGENVELSKWEILRLCESYGKIENFDTIGRILVVKWRGRDFFYRIALAHEVCEVLHESESLEGIESYLEHIPIPTGSCCIRVTSFIKVDKMKLEKDLGAILWKRGAKISVSSPNTIFKIYITENRCFLCRFIHKPDKKQFLLRRPDKRPFFMPSVVLPKFARALVNLSGTRSNLLDPMCGTGSFLIEAELMGIEAFGMDLFEKIVRGCRENLLYYDLPPNVVVGDARAIPFKDESIDAIVTDYPYLRSTKTSGRIDELYELSSSEIERVLKPGKYAVVVTNIDAEEYFKDFIILSKFTQRVHSSLTRRIYLLKKSY